MGASMRDQDQKNTKAPKGAFVTTLLRWWGSPMVGIAALTPPYATAALLTSRR
jgi:hypothetical protein